VQGRQVRDTFFGLFTCLRPNNLNPVSCRHRIQHIHQRVLVILAEPSSGDALLKVTFDDNDAMGEGEEAFELLQQSQAIGWIRDRRMKFLDALPLYAQEVWCFSNRIVAGRECLPNGAGDSNEASKLVGLLLMTVDEQLNGGHSDIWPAFPRERNE